MWLRFLSLPLILVGGFLVTSLLVFALIIALAYPNLPSLQALTEYQPKVPLRIYTAEGIQIGEFGEERRAVVSIADVPAALKNAIIAAEDERFYEHAGIDYLGVLRAAYANLAAGGRRQGASTITMQVARNFFLSSEKTLTRKLYEALLAFKIEHSLTKQQILELYVNEYSVHAEYAAEMVRQAIAEHYPDDVYSRGFRVYTTLRKADQEAAYQALRKGVLDYDRRNGYRGPEGFSELPAKPEEDDYEDALNEHPDSDDLMAAIVTNVDARQIDAALRTGEMISITAAESLRFAARALDRKTAPQQRIRRGSTSRV